MIYVAGEWWGTADEIADHLGPDVTPAMVRAWARRRLLASVRAGATVRYPVGAAASVEASTALSGRGRPRRLDTGRPITA